MTKPTAQQIADAIARVEAADMTPLGKADCLKRIKDGSFFKADPNLIRFDHMPTTAAAGALPEVTA